jgi:ATP synthase F1 delta subunit
MNHRAITHARKYAQAFIAVFGMNHEWLEDIQSLITIFNNNRSLLIVLALPRHSSQDILKTLHTSFAHLPCWHAVEKLVNVLIAHQRILLITEIFEQIIALYNESQGILPCIVGSSHPLPEADKKCIQRFIEQKTHYKAHCTYTINPALIAGIRIQAQTLFWHYSIRAQLQAIRTALMR